VSNLVAAGSVIKIRNKRWKVGAVMNPGERYYLLQNPKDENDVGFFPASWVEHWVTGDEKRRAKKEKP
jgi:hypothetical protein